MNSSSSTATWGPPSPIRHRFVLFKPFSISCSMPRPPNRHRRTRRRNPNTDPTTTTTTTTGPTTPAFYTSSDSENIQATFDLNTLYSSSHARLRRFLSDASDAAHDLQTLVTVDADRRIFVSCRPSTLRFAGTFFMATVAAVVGIRILLAVVMLGFGSGSGYGTEKVVTRRDRSLGGKEVVVARIEKPRAAGKESIVGSKSSLSSMFQKNRVRFGDRLPHWWPTSTNSKPILGDDNEEHQREANRLVRAITDDRMGGKDIMEDDIIHLRQICRIYGVRVSFDTTHTRDSLYRVSVDFVLNVCSRAPSHSDGVEIEGEDARQFIAGLAENIGLENVRAGNIVSAAVAARTRSCLLQAWALVMQGKHAEAAVELLKICLVWRIFPPEESSPEIEMVARGLEKHLKMDQREFLMSMFVGTCSEKSQKIAAEALGLVSSFKGVGDEQ